METKKIVVEVESNLGSLKSQLREAQAEVSAMSEKFGATSVEAINAAKAAARLKDTIGDAKQLTDAFNPDAKFKALTASMSGALNGFQAVEGAMGLFGAEGVEVQKMLLKVQSAMALAQGVDGLLEAKDAFKTFGASVVENFKSLANGAKAAFSTVKGAIAATGIGLLVVALGYVVSNFDEISAKAKTAATSTNNWLNSSTTTAKATKKYLEWLLLPITLMIDLYHKVEDAILGTNDATRAVSLQQQKVADARNRQLEEEKNAQISVVKGLDRKIALLESEGKSTIALRKEKQKLQLQEAEMNLQALQFVAQAMSGSDVMKGLYAELINNAKDTVNKLKIEGNNITTDAKAENQKKLDDAKANTEKRNTLADEEYKHKRELAEDERLFNESTDAWVEEGYQKEKARIEKEKQDAIDLEFTKRNQIALTAQLTEEKRLLDEVAGQKELEREKSVQKAKMQMASDAIGVIGELANALAGKSEASQKRAFNINKAASIAQATISTYQAAQSAYASQMTIPSPDAPIRAAVSAGIAVASGIAKVAMIAKTQFNGGGGGGGGGDKTPTSLPASSAPTPANFNLVGNSNTNQLLQGLQNQPIQAYVVGGDVTSQQSLDRNKITTASI